MRGIEEEKARRWEDRKDGDRKMGGIRRITMLEVAHDCE